jgi:hypothetical protein
MATYPKILLSHKPYPFLSNEEISGSSLVRETVIDLYPILNKRGYAPDDIVRFIVAPQPSLREVFELSVFLYGCYDERILNYGQKIARGLVSPEIRATPIQNIWQSLFWNTSPRKRSSKKPKSGGLEGNNLRGSTDTK